MKKYQMEYWPIEKLTSYKNNTKTHPDTQVEKIANSIKLYGFDQPISVDINGIIIKGHGRLLASQFLGLTEVPVIVRNDLSIVDAAAARIADNKVAESPWDENLLPIELEMLDSHGVNLEESTGFSDEELKEIFKDLEFDAGSGSGGDGTEDSLSDEKSEHVKMIQLFYAPEKEKEFRSICEKLAEKYQTENLSDTVYAALIYAIG